MTTTAKPASNGSTDTTTAETAGEPEKAFGMARVREAEIYHNASVLHDAVFEAERLCTAVHQAVSDAYFKEIRKDREARTGMTATQTAESPQVQAKVQEALNCLHAAEEYTKRLLVSTYQPPF
jgi:hypothetical protein